LIVDQILAKAGTGAILLPPEQDKDKDLVPWIREQLEQRPPAACLWYKLEFKTIKQFVVHLLLLLGSRLSPSSLRRPLVPPGLDDQWSVGRWWVISDRRAVIDHLSSGGRLTLFC
jgi:hypothetical protein